MCYPSLYHPGNPLYSHSVLCVSSVVSQVSQSVHTKFLYISIQVLDTKSSYDLPVTGLVSMRKLFDAQVWSGPRGCLCLGEPKQAIHQPHHLEQNGAFAGLGLQAGCVKLKYLFSAKFSYYFSGSVNGDTLQMGCVKAKFYLDGVYPTANRPHGPMFCQRVSS